MRPETRLKRKFRSIKKLAKSAIDDKPVWKASKGYKYLEDCNAMDKVQTSSGLEAIAVEPEVGQVLVIDTSKNIPKEDKPFYMGYRRWACKTEVIIIKELINEK